MHRTQPIAFSILITLLAAPAALMAQRTTATISGTVTDQTTAMVPAAQVTAVEKSTGASSQAQANSEGFYVLSGVLPGEYRLRVEKEGFQAYVQEGIVVQVNRPVSVNVTLQVGAATQTVNVAAEAPAGQPAFANAQL